MKRITYGRPVDMITTYHRGMLIAPSIQQFPVFWRRSTHRRFRVRMTSSSPPLIGILGGMGPQAGLDMAEKLLKLTRTQRDQDHLPFVLFSLPNTVPDRTSFLLGQADINPAHAIADQFESMYALGVSIAVMACNTAHAKPIFDLVLKLLKEKGVELRILNLIDETINWIQRSLPQTRRVGILGTRGTLKTRLYDDALEAVGLEPVLIDTPDLDDEIHAALYSPSFGIKSCSGTITPEAKSRVRAAIQHLHQLGAEAVILGCTELPLAIDQEKVDGIPIIDPARIAAERLILEICPELLATSA